MAEKAWIEFDKAHKEVSRIHALMEHLAHKKVEPQEFASIILKEYGCAMGKAIKKLNTSFDDLMSEAKGVALNPN